MDTGSLPGLVAARLVCILLECFLVATGLNKKTPVFSFRIELSQVAVLWARPLGVLNTALNLSEVITERIASLEAEILLNLGI